MPEEIRNAQRRRVRLGKTLDRIAAHIERSLVTFGAGPDSSALREFGKGLCDGDNYGFVASPPRKRDDMAAPWAAHLQRLVVSAGKQVRKFDSQFQEVPGPRQLQMPVGPIL